MAETVVLAELTIDAAGVIRGFGVAGAATDQAGRKLGEFERRVRATHGPVDQLAQRMFNLRTAAVALLGGFTLGGLIFSIRSFVEKAVEGAAAFGDFNESLETAKKRLGEVFVQVFNVNGALESLTGWLDRFVFLSDKLNKLSEDNPVVAKIGAINRFLYGIQPVGLAIKGIEKAGELIDKMSGREAKEKFIGPPAPAGIGSEPRFTPALDETMKKQKELMIQQMLLIEGYHNLAGDADAAFTDMGDGLEVLTFNMKETVEATAHLKFGLDEVGAAGEAAAALIGQGLAGGLGSATEAAGKLLQMLAIIAWGRVAAYTAAAVGSTTGLGAAIEGGTPAQFAASAALWKNVAIISSIGAALMGGLSSGDRGGGGGRGSTGGAGAGAGIGGPLGQREVVYVYVMGPPGVLNESGFSRYIKEAQRRGERGNA